MIYVYDHRLKEEFLISREFYGMRIFKLWGNRLLQCNKVKRRTQLSSFYSHAIW
jgi:hypothetical protein